MNNKILFLSIIALIINFALIQVNCDGEGRRNVQIRTKFQVQTGAIAMNPRHGWNGGNLGFMAKGRGRRVSTRYVSFRFPFSQKPVMSYGLVNTDTGHKNNQRISVELYKVSRYGFGVRFITWADSVVYGLKISWSAFGN